MASAGSITGTSNTTTATQSICPRGWTLPSKLQVNSIGLDYPDSNAMYVAIFSPALGGAYENSILSYENTAGRWWSSEARNIVGRYYLSYDRSVNDALWVSYDYRYRGLSIRCVSSS